MKTCLRTRVKYTRTHIIHCICEIVSSTYSCFILYMHVQNFLYHRGNTSECKCIICVREAHVYNLYIRDVYNMYNIEYEIILLKCVSYLYMFNTYL